MVTTLGTELGTILGTELGSLKDVYGFDTRLLYALSNFSAANFYQTAVDGGEAGVATGFVDIALVRIDTLPTLATAFFERIVASPASGHNLNSGANTLTFSASSSAPAWVTISHTVTASDIGKLFLVAGSDTSSALQLWTQRRKSAEAAITGYTPSASGTRFSIGARVPGGNAAAFLSFLAGMTLRGVPSDEQLRALFDQARLLGDLPAVFPLGSATDADIAALAPRHWYRADTFTPNAGNLGALTNRNTTVGGQFVMTAGTLALPAPDPLLNGALAVAFNRTQHMQSSFPASEWRLLHDGSGVTLFFIFRPTDPAVAQHYFGTVGGLALAGFFLRHVSGALRVGIGANGSGAGIVGDLSLGTSIIGSAYAVEIVHASSALPNFLGGQNQPLIAVNPYVFAPSVGVDPPETLRLGSSSGGGTNAGMSFGELLIFDRVLTESERQKVRDYIRVRYGVGAITTHRWSLRDVLRGLDLPVTDGQTAPANLPDTVTAATIDRMDRQGSPTVKLIDPNTDGRKSYGALGFSGMNYFKSAGPTNGIVPTTPRWWVLWNGYFDAVSGNFSTLVGTTSNRFQGYQLYHHTTGSLGAFIQDSVGAVTAASASNVVATSDLLQPQVVILNQDGATLKIYFKGLEVASIAATLAPVVGSSPGMSIGVQGNGSGVFASGGTYCVQGGMSAALTLAEIAQLTASPRTAIAKTQRLYDLTQDVIANGGPENGVPLTVLDRIGTDHLTRVGGLQLNTAGGIAGLTKWAPANVAATRAGGGLAGVGTGFFRAFDLILGPYTTTNGIFGKSDGGNNGDYFRITTSGLQWVVGDGGAVARSAILPLVAGDVTTRQRCVIQHDGANIRIYLGTSTNTISVACAGHTPYAAGPMSLGDILPNGASAQGTSTIYGMQSGNAILTAGEISALLADTTFAAVAGKTTYRVWIPDDVAEAGGKVPAVLKERISGTDNLTVTGAPLQVAQRLEKLWSYERTPILYGTGDHSLANKYTAANGGAGNTLAFGGTLVWRPNATTVSAIRVLLSSVIQTPNRGFDIRTSGTNATISATMNNAANGGVTSGAGSLVGLYGKTCIFSFQFDGVTGRLRAYLNRVEVGTGVVAAGYAPPTGAITWGAERVGTTAPGTDNDLFGFVLWDGLATLAQVQSQHDAILANDGRIQRMPGVNNTMLIDVTADAQANGGALPLLEDRIGNNDFTKVGSPIVATQYARAFGF